MTRGVKRGRGRGVNPTRGRGRGRGRSYAGVPEPLPSPPLVGEDFETESVNSGYPVNPQATKFSTGGVIPPVNRVEMGGSGLTIQTKMLKEFREHGPKEFDGTSVDPGEAERWIAKVEKILGYVACPDDLKVHCGAYLLTDDAMNWWDSTSQSLASTGPVTWEKF